MTLSLHEQRKKLNHLFDLLINNRTLPEKDFDNAMQQWIYANKKLETKEEKAEFTNTYTKSTWNQIAKYC